MWPHRLALGAAVLPLTLLALRDAPVRPVLPAPAAHERPRPVPRGAPQPAVVSRAAWRADERMVREPADYTGAVRAVFIHRTGESSDYDCADVPRMLRAVEEAHIKGNGWDDIGYNFLAPPPPRRQLARHGLLLVARRRMARGEGPARRPALTAYGGRPPVRCPPTGGQRVPPAGAAGRRAPRTSM